MMKKKTDPIPHVVDVDAIASGVSRIRRMLARHDDVTFVDDVLEECDRIDLAAWGPRVRMDQPVPASSREAAEGLHIKFRKKPVVIEAMQFLNFGHPSSHEIMAWAKESQPPSLIGRHTTDGVVTLSIPTLEGTMTAEVGDWIIRGVKGEFYPCKPDIFDATYEPAERGEARPKGIWLSPDHVNQIMCALEGWEAIDPSDDENRRRAAFELIQELHEPTALAAPAAPLRMENYMPIDAHLLPCPFCGEKAVLTNVRMSDHTFHVSCVNESCFRPRTDGYGSKADVVALWNQRAAPAAPPETDDKHREHYRAGYSAGWSDGRNGSPMEDERKCAMFFGPELHEPCRGLGCDACQGTGEKPIPVLAAPAAGEAQPDLRSDAEDVIWALVHITKDPPYESLDSDACEEIVFAALVKAAAPGRRAPAQED